MISLRYCLSPSVVLTFTISPVRFRCVLLSERVPIASDTFIHEVTAVKGCMFYRDAIYIRCTAVSRFIILVCFKTMDMFFFSDQCAM